MILIRSSLVVLALLVASPITLGCLTVKGTAKSEAFSAEVSIHANDNGLAVCDGNSMGGDGYVPCRAGYILHFNYKDNPMGGPLPMTYTNIAGNRFELRVGLDCSFDTQCCREY